MTVALQIGGSVLFITTLRVRRLVGYVPGFPGAHTQGETREELTANLQEVISMLLEDGEPQLAPSSLVRETGAQLTKPEPGLRRIRSPDGEQ